MQPKSPIEPVSREQLNAIIAAVRRAHGPIGVMVSGLLEADWRKGRRLVMPGNYEMWTMDKKKITIALIAEGGLCVSCGKTEDPDYPI